MSAKVPLLIDSFKEFLTEQGFDKLNVPAQTALMKAYMAGAARLFENVKTGSCDGMENGVIIFMQQHVELNAFKAFQQGMSKGDLS